MVDPVLATGGSHFHAIEKIQAWPLPGLVNRTAQAWKDTATYYYAE